MAGIGALSGQAMEKLKAGLASQSAPANSATPAAHLRADPAESTLLDMQRVRRALEVAKSHLEETDPQQVLIGAMHGAVSRLLSKVDLSDAVDVLLEQAFPLSSQHLKERLQSMFSPPLGLGGGAAPGVQPPGQPSGMPGTGSPFAPGGQPSAPTGSGVPAGGGDMPSAV